MAPEMYCSRATRLGGSAMATTAALSTNAPAISPSPNFLKVFMMVLLPPDTTQRNCTVSGAPRRDMTSSPRDWGMAGMNPVHNQTVAEMRGRYRDQGAGR